MEKSSGTSETMDGFRSIKSSASPYPSVFNYRFLSANRFPAVTNRSMKSTKMIDTHPKKEVNWK